MSMMMLKHLTRIFFLVFVISSVLFGQQPGDPRIPVSWEFNIGGMGPLGKASDSYSGSFLIGGGASVPITRWFSADLFNLDFGFGNLGGSRTLSGSDGSRRETKSYQILFSTGGRVNLPLGRGAALGLGGGYGNISQIEYVPGRSFYQNNVLVTEDNRCPVCIQQSFQGPYLQARLFGRATKYNGVGVTAKYFITRDTDKGYFSLPPQRWLTVSLTFSFGI